MPQPSTSSWSGDLYHYLYTQLDHCLDPTKQPPLSMPFVLAPKGRTLGEPVRHHSPTSGATHGRSSAVHMLALMIQWMPSHSACLAAGSTQATMYKVLYGLQLKLSSGTSLRSHLIQCHHLCEPDTDQFLQHLLADSPIADASVF